MFKEKYLRRLEITTSKDVSLMKLRNDPRVPSQSDNSIYDLYTIPKDAVLEDCRSSDLNATWVARNQFVVPDKNHVGSLNSFVSFFNCFSLIFYSGTRLLLIRENGHLSLYDAQQKRSAYDSVVFLHNIKGYYLCALINGDHEIICTLDLPIYVTKLQGNSVFVWIEKKYDEVKFTNFFSKLVLGASYFHFVQDEKKGFGLPLECGDIDVN
ncbi:unnamed protein product [Rotaria sp. Silwood1]|nr:unnamed protein product [Rotaria sp. Silwood1]CAF1692257.1 unnamed protein product [Rotaria sp. Silwood1]